MEILFHSFTIYFPSTFLLLILYKTSTFPLLNLYLTATKLNKRSSCCNKGRLFQNKRHLLFNKCHLFGLRLLLVHSPSHCHSQPGSLLFTAGLIAHSHGGNALFPAWEHFVPSVGISYSQRGNCSSSWLEIIITLTRATFLLLHSRIADNG